MENIEFHSFNPEEFNNFVSDPEKRRNQILFWVILGIIGVLMIATGWIMQYNINQRIMRIHPKKDQGF